MAVTSLRDANGRPLSPEEVAELLAATPSDGPLPMFGGREGSLAGNDGLRAKFADRPEMQDWLNQREARILGLDVLQEAAQAAAAQASRGSLLPAFQAAPPPADPLPTFRSAPQLPPEAMAPLAPLVPTPPRAPPEIVNPVRQPPKPDPLPTFQSSEPRSDPLPTFQPPPPPPSPSLSLPEIPAPAPQAEAAIPHIPASWTPAEVFTPAAPPPPTPEAPVSPGSLFEAPQPASAPAAITFAPAPAALPPVPEIPASGLIQATNYSAAPEMPGYAQARTGNPFRAKQTGLFAAIANSAPLPALFGGSAAPGLYAPDYMTPPDDEERRSLFAKYSNPYL